MLNFILPNAYFYLQINKQLFEVYSTKRECFIDEIKFIGEDANFAFNIWNGGTLINDAFLNKKDIFSLYDDTTPLPLFIDCSNYNIKNTDIFNIKENLFLEAYQTGTNIITISDINLFNLLKTKYPYYKFATSPFFNGKQEDYKNFDYYFQYYNKLDDSLPKHKTIIILPLNNKCYTCPNYLDCIKKEQDNIYYFKTQSQFRNCVNNQPFILNIPDYKKLIKKGYNNFSFEDRSVPLFSPLYYLNTYITIFVKDEYKDYIYNLLLEGLKW